MLTRPLLFRLINGPGPNRPARREGCKRRNGNNRDFGLRLMIDLAVSTDNKNREAVKNHWDQFSRTSFIRYIG